MTAVTYVRIPPLLLSLTTILRFCNLATKKDVPRMMLTIRTRSNVDLDACVSVLEKVYDKDKYPVQGVSQAKQFLSGDSIQQAWVCEKDGHIVGHVAASRKMSKDDVSMALWTQQHPDDPNSTAVLERLFVDPDSRGLGVAGQLIEAAVAWSHEKHMRLVLFALEKDKVAARLYERLGWSHFGTTAYHYDDGKTMDALCFVSPKSG
jgi:GNAT superfamily N-acetyltransferase